ncbi:outer membrane protein assembly factor [Polaromonas sp.]|nr:outer membrane protein assembly factor [Polaromonas sp.]
MFLLLVLLLAAPLAQAATSAALAAEPTAPEPETPTDSISPEPTPADTLEPNTDKPEVTTFDIAVRGPKLVRELLETHLELQRYRAVTDLDEAELARLIVQAESNARNLLGTLGYFSPDIHITREGGLNEKPVIAITVEPGPATQTGAVKITFAGDIADSSDPDALAQRLEIERDWRLPTGQPFTQNSWSSAKTQALRALVARRYPAGKLAGSLANVDAPMHSASLLLSLDSGPLYRLGPLQVRGVKRYDPVLVPRLARLKEGDIYDQSQLVAAQQRLASSGYFSSAYVSINPDSDPVGDPLATPVQVQVREAPLQKVILGLGVTTDNGPRASFEHSHLRVPGIGWRAVTKVQVEKDSPFAQTDWTAIPDEDNWRWGVLGRIERQDDGTLITQAQRLRFGRSQIGEQIDRNIYLQYDRANIQGVGRADNSEADIGDGSALTANYVWTGRYFDSLPFPSHGYALGFELGLGSTLGQERQPFSRTLGRWLGIYSLEKSRIALRAEAGAVVGKASARIPATQMFRTGGDTTVRGYGYRDIGITLNNGVIGPGRYMTISSVEWQRPMMLNGRPSEFENTLFIDAGAVADKAKDLSPVFGIGTGVRWRSPIGPLQMDLAYGLKVKHLRLHISVGFVF